MNLVEFYIEDTIVGFPISYVKEKAIEHIRTNLLANSFILESNGGYKILPCVKDAFTSDKSGKKMKGNFKGGNSCHKVCSLLGYNIRNVGCGGCYRECIEKFENKELLIVKK